MKQALLITYDNPRFRAAFNPVNYSVREYELPVSADTLRLIETVTWCESILVEVLADSVDQYGELFNRIQNKGRIIVLVDRMTDAVRRFLLEQGVADVLMGADRDDIGTYLATADEAGTGDRGSIVILDDNLITRRLLKSIIERFNYAPVLIDTVDELFNNCLNSGVRFILVNLGTRLLDLNGLVRKFYDHRGVKKIPVIVYKDMREGLFVHELVGGLNRLTRYILSHDELYSLLVDLLFKKEVMPRIAALKKLSGFDENAPFVDESVSQAFFLNEKNIFGGSDILGDDNFPALAGAARSLRSSLVMTMGLRWLRIGIDKKNFNTAERGG